jgi:hypothetical protein
LFCVCEIWTVSERKYNTEVHMEEINWTGSEKFSDVYYHEVKNRGRGELMLSHGI